MPLDEKQALKRQTGLLTTSQSSRAAHEAYCGLCLVYAYGSQWASSGGTGQRQGHSLQQLRTIVDADRSDVRMTMNVIRSRITKLNSRLAPRSIESRCVPASRAMNDIVAAMVADGRLQLHLEEVDALRKLKQVSLWRLVLGSGLIRQCMWKGESVTGRDAAGKPTGQEVPTIAHAWDVTAPYEYIRDPSARSVTFDGEDCIGHEKPRTLAWLKRHFGISKEQLGETSTMGKLLEYQKFMYKATGQSLDYGWSDSEAPAVMVGEWWHRDDDRDPLGRWPWYCMTYRNTAGADAAARGLKSLHFSPNPYHGLPIHHFWFEDQLGCPWGKGVPALAIQAQDMINLSFTNLMRHQAAHSHSKYIVEENSLVDDIATALGNNPRRPVVIRKGSAPLKRMESPPPDQTTMAIIDSSPTWMDWLLNMAPVQFGQSAGKHPEAGRAIDIRKDEADTPITAVSDGDEIALNRLLTADLFNLIRHETPEALEELLSHEFTRKQILTLKEQDVRRTLIGVRIEPETLRPQTPQEMREDAMVDIKTQMTNPVSARRSLLVRGRITIDEKESRAYRKQLQEIAMILDGQDVPAAIGQDHDMHQWTLDLETESSRWDSYTEEQQVGLMAHWQEHQQHKEIRARLNQSIEQVEQGAEEIPPPPPPEEQAPMEGPALGEAGFAQPEWAGSPGAEPAMAAM